MAEISRGAKWGGIGLLTLTVLTGVGNLVATNQQISDQNAQFKAVQAQQHRQGEVLALKLCTTFTTLAALKPPPGPAKTNPSRAYEQQLHVVLDRLGTDLGCK